jgi:uncharacterized Fe-S cluster protein YjdI
MKTTKDTEASVQTNAQNTIAWQDNPDKPIVFENMEWIAPDEAEKAEAERRIIAAVIAQTGSPPIRPIRVSTIVL